MRTVPERLADPLRFDDRTPDAASGNRRRSICGLASRTDFYLDQVSGNRDDNLAPGPIMGLLNHSMNRRLAHLRLTSSGFSRAVGLGPNVAGERDEGARVLKFVDPSGRPLAIVWNYACHASDFFDSLRISAAFPGQVRKRLRSELGAIPVLFLQGFSGDVRPPFPGLSPDIRSLAKRVLRGPQFKNAPSQREWEAWSGSLADRVTAIARCPAAPLQIGEPMTRRSKCQKRPMSRTGTGVSLFAGIWSIVAAFESPASTPSRWSVTAACCSTLLGARPCPPRAALIRPIAIYRSTKCLGREAMK